MHYFIVLVIITACVKCFNIEVHIYSTLLLPPPLFFGGGGGGSSWLFCHFDVDVYIYSTCTFLIVKRILMLILYSAASL